MLYNADSGFEWCRDDPKTYTAYCDCFMHSFFRNTRMPVTDPNSMIGSGGIGNYSPKKCIPLYRNDSKLLYGAGVGKLGTHATNAEIWSCITDGVPTGSYNEVFNNCNDFMSRAINACGLSTYRGKDLF